MLKNAIFLENAFIFKKKHKKALTGQSPEFCGKVSKIFENGQIFFFKFVLFQNVEKLFHKKTVGNNIFTIFSENSLGLPRQNTKIKKSDFLVFFGA